MEWISVLDRLPSYGEVVLCFGYDCDLKSIFIGELKQGYISASGGYENYVSMYNGAIATHWMPLPDPPKP